MAGDVEGHWNWLDTAILCHLGLYDYQNNDP